MANNNLTSAKTAKNDEFYTRYSDIQKEIEAYLEYDKDTFRGKVIYCNCDDPYESNFFKFFVLNFKRLGLRRLITTSYKPSPVANTQLGLFGDDKTISPEKGRPKVTANKFIINDVGDANGDGAFNLGDVAEQLRANKNNEWTPLKGEGDFRSDECVELLRQADIIVTNPPFSLFREYIRQLYDYNKKFIILSNKGAVIYKEVFPLFQENRLWSGRTTWGGGMWFETTNLQDVDKVIDGKNMKNVPSIWLTNIDHGRRHEKIHLMSIADNLKFNKKMKDKIAYDHYDNYDAIEVPFTNAIPNDYDGIMGVPVSFLDKYSPEQFEIIWQASGNTRASAPKEILEVLNYRPHAEDRGGCGVINGGRVFSRILIRHRKEENV
ncbi:adenine-specific methyltransferase EcoRI family protein [Candidatus Saccharibacteria bacterium]|nr:adenine-specific methyltransferase EcoRI family protein [Candidatus Saccharibacteria bacterium]